ncbi:hypothetical protein GCM10011393_20930 [Sphingopyxis bauzanensis]|nr:hypothetical protein GCM10011393_20930 [Sphingopyxis bauzanensis]
MSDAFEFRDGEGRSQIHAGFPTSHPANDAASLESISQRQVNAVTDIHQSGVGNCRTVPRQRRDVNFHPPRSQQQLPRAGYGQSQWTIMLRLLFCDKLSHHVSVPNRAIKRDPASPIAGPDNPAPKADGVG